MQIGKNNALHPIKAISPPSIEVTSFVFSYINGISGRINVGIAIALWINNNARSTFSFLSIAIAIKKVATQRKKYASKSIAKNAVPFSIVRGFSLWYKLGRVHELLNRHSER